MKKCGRILLNNPEVTQVFETGEERRFSAAGSVSYRALIVVVIPAT